MFRSSWLAGFRCANELRLQVMAVLRSARQHPGLASIFMEYVRQSFTDRLS